MVSIAFTVMRVSSRKTLDLWHEAFGVEVVAIYPEDATDVIEHAELRLGEGRIMSGTPKDEGPSQGIDKGSVYWVLDTDDEVDALHARAVAAGAESMLEPYDADYGGRHCTLRDPDGHVWSFGSYRGADG